MKKVYESPKMVVEQFEANEYIAACGDQNLVYKFKCTAGGGKSGTVYLETNGEAGLQTTGRNADRYLSGYHACGKEHEASTTDDFLSGYYVVDGGWFEDDTITPVIVWRGPNNDNTHCTENLDMDSWETAKS